MTRSQLFFTTSLNSFRDVPDENSKDAVMIRKK